MKALPAISPLDAVAAAADLTMHSQADELWLDHLFWRGSGLKHVKLCLTAQTMSIKARW